MITLWEVGLGALLVLSAIVEEVERGSRKKKRSTAKPKRKTPAKGAYTSASVRSDEEILRTPLNQLGHAEFEQLLVLYFKGTGKYDVIHQGKGGDDGGVDLILVDKRTKERTAVQAKHWGHGSVGPDKIRELHSARWSTKPRCLYGLLITSNEITAKAREAAFERGIEFWHGASLEHRLEQWGQWKPGKNQKKRRPQR